MPTYTFPSAAELLEIEQEKIPVLVQDDELFSLFPMEDADADLLVWDQLDNFVGLQAVRGLGGAPGRVKRVGSKQYQMQPGYYGEFMEITEAELTVRRELGTWGDPVSLDRLVLQLQDQLLSRRLDRIRQIMWTLLTTGTFSVARPSEEGGGTVHTDTFSLQNFTANPLWSSTTTSHPLADLRELKLKGRGKGVNFDSRAKIFCNQTTINNVLNSTTATDIFARRQNGLSTINNINEVNELLTKDDLPNFVPYDKGYLNDSGTFVNFIPDGKAVLVGNRITGSAIGKYRMTRNANNPNSAPGPYTRVIDLGEMQLPRKVVVHDGHNGGPVIYYPGSVVWLNV